MSLAAHHLSLVIIDLHDRPPTDLATLPGERSPHHRPGDAATPLRKRLLGLRCQPSAGTTPFLRCLPEHPHHGPVHHLPALLEHHWAVQRCPRRLRRLPRTIL